MATNKDTKAVKYIQRFFIVGLVLGCIFFSILIYSISINFLPIAFIFFLICMYSFSRIHKEKFIEPSNYLFPIFISLSISFAIISFIFGLHNDVFVSYDKNDLKLEDEYKWFKAEKILKFPIIQLENKIKPNVEEVDFNSLKDTTERCHIIIVDKTASLTNSDSSVNNFMLQKIKEVYNVNYKITQYSKTSLLIPPYIVRGLHENIRNSNANERVVFFYHTGYESDLNTLDNDNDSYTANLNTQGLFEKPTLINDYFKRNLIYDETIDVNNKKKNIPQKTSFNQIINSLTKKLKECDEFKGKFIIVSIISDFINSDTTEIIPDFASIPQINELNLYILNGKDNENPNSSSLKLVDRMTKNYTHLKEKRIINFQNISDAEQFYNNLIATNLQYYDHKNEKFLHFYMPYKSFNTNQEAKAEIIFNDINNTENDDGQYIIRVTNIDDEANLFPILYKTKFNRDRTAVNSGDLFSITMSLKDTLSLFFPNTSKISSDRLFIEISSLNSNKKESMAIDFMPLLPNSTCYYLIFCYSIFIFSISFILILPNIAVYYLIKKNKVENNSSWHVIALALPISLGLVTIFCSLLFLYIHNLSIFDFTLIVLLLFSIPAFLSTITEYPNNKTGGPHKFHILGTILGDLKILFIKQDIAQNEDQIMSQNIELNKNKITNQYEIPFDIIGVDKFTAFLGEMDAIPVSLVNHLLKNDKIFDKSEVVDSALYGPEISVGKEVKFNIKISNQELQNVSFRVIGDGVDFSFSKILLESMHFNSDISDGFLKRDI